MASSDGAGVGLGDYEWCINDAANCGTPNRTGTTASPAVTANSAGTALTDGTYYSCVRALDDFGNVSAYTCSDTFILDATDPTGGTVTPPTGATSVTSVNVAWTAPTEANPGTLALQRDEVGYSGGACGLFPGNFSTTVAANLLVPGTSPYIDTTEYDKCYRYRTVATDAAGNSETFTSGNTVQVVDSVNPTDPGAVNNGDAIPPAADLDITNNALTLKITWTAGTDAETGVAGYDWCINEEADCSTTPDRTGSVGVVTTVASTAAAITDGTYRSCVRTVDASSNVSAYVCSGAFVIDTTDPTGGTVTPPNGPTAVSGVSVAWTAPTEANPGTLALQRDEAVYSLGSCGTFANSFSPVAANLLTGGSPYVDTTEFNKCYKYRTVATDAAGNTATFNSANIVQVVDSVNPTAPATVNDGAAAPPTADVDYTNNAASFTITWTAGTDTGSGVAGYDWCINEEADCTTSTIRTGSVGATTNVTSSGGALADGVYNSCVRSADASSNNSGYTCSDTFALDTVAPTGGSITAVLSDTAATVTFGGGVDTGGTGVASSSVVRASAPLSNGTCGSFSGATALLSASGAQDTGLAPATCYRYTLTVADNAGNTQTAASTVQVPAANPPSFATVPSTAEFVAGSDRIRVPVLVTGTITKVDFRISSRVGRTIVQAFAGSTSTDLIAREALDANIESGDVPWVLVYTDSNGIDQRKTGTIKLKGVKSVGPSGGTFTDTWRTDVEDTDDETLVILEGRNWSDVNRWTMTRLAEAKGDGPCPENVRGSDLDRRTVANGGPDEIAFVYRELRAGTCVQYRLDLSDEYGNVTTVLTATSSTGLVQEVVRALQVSITLSTSFPEDDAGGRNADQFIDAMADVLGISTDRIKIIDVQEGSRATKAPMFKMRMTRVGKKKTAWRVRIVPTKAGRAYFKKNPKKIGTRIKLQGPVNVRLKNGTFVQVNQKFNYRVPRGIGRTVRIG